MTDPPTPPAEPAAPPSPPRPARWPAALLLGLLALGVAAAIAWGYRVTRPDRRLARGEEAVRAKDWADAEWYARKLDEVGRPDHARVLRAELFLARNAPGPALEELKGIDPDGPLRRRALRLVGRALLGLREMREAHGVYRQLLADDPDDVDAHRGLATIAYELGQMGEAIGHTTRAAELAPADARPYRFIAKIHADDGNAELAEGAYRAALARDPEPKLRGEILFELTGCLLQQKKYPEALEVLDLARAEAGGADPAYMLLFRADCLRALGRLPEAREVLARTLEVDPDGAEVHRLKGHLLLDEDRPAEAAAALERSLAQVPAHYPTQFLLAQAYAAAGRKADADRANARANDLKRDYELLSDLSRAASDRPWDPGVRLQLAEVCDRLQKKDLAAMWRGAAAALTGGR